MCFIKMCEKSRIYNFNELKKYVLTFTSHFLSFYIYSVTQMDFVGYYDCYNGKLNATLYSSRKCFFFPTSVIRASSVYFGIIIPF